MKRKAKNIIFLAGLITLPSLINYIIFKNSNRKYINKEEKYYNWRFGSIRYITAGEGEPILLIHDINTGGSLDEWSENILKLSKHYKVYAIDLLGFGLSERPKISYSAYLYISLINDFIKDIIKEKVYIVASLKSSGFAIMCQSFKKEFIKKIIIISPEITIKPTNKFNIFKKSLLESPIIGTSIYNILTSKLSLKYLYEKKCFNYNNYSDKSVIENIYINAHNKGAASKYPFAAYMSGFLDVNFLDIMKKCEIPIQILCGKNNEKCELLNYKKINKYPNIKVTIIEDSKYYPHIENPRVFYKICCKFFK